MPRANLPLAEELLRRLRSFEQPDGTFALPARVQASSLAKLAQEVMCDDLALYPHGEMLVWDIARREGYVIPPYPLAGCGESVEFLAEYGATDVPGWYELRGITREVTSSFYAYGCVMARNRGFWRRIWAVPTAQLEQPHDLAAWLARALAFSFGNETDREDPRLFKC